MSGRVRVLLCAAMLIVGLTQTAVAGSRSLIPYAIDGTLEKSRSVPDTQGRLHNVYIDGDTFVTDNQTIAELEPWQHHLQKDAWSTTLSIDDGDSVRLRLGDEAIQFAVLTLLAVGATWLLTGLPGRTADRN